MLVITGSNGFVLAHVITVDINIRYRFLDSPPPSSASGGLGAAGICFSSKSLRTKNRSQDNDVLDRNKTIKFLDMTISD